MHTPQDIPAPDEPATDIPPAEPAPIQDPPLNPGEPGSPELPDQVDPPLKLFEMAARWT